MFVNVFLWGVVVACSSAATNFGGLLASRFFLGIFEATVGEQRHFKCEKFGFTVCLAPCFITVTQMVSHYYLAMHYSRLTSMYSGGEEGSKLYDWVYGLLRTVSLGWSVPC